MFSLILCSIYSVVFHSLYLLVFIFYVFITLITDLNDLSLKSFDLFSDGYAFSQDENGVVSQSEVIRAYDTTKQRTENEW